MPRFSRPVAAAARSPESGEQFKARRGRNSFSLIEVVIAIAVVTFGLLSVLGLMAYSSKMVHESDNYFRLAVVSGQMLSKLSSQSFFTTSTAAQTNAAYYYSFEGLPTNVAGAYYQCNITNATPSTWPLPKMMPVQLILRWPMTNASGQTFRNTNFIISSALNYD